MADEVGHGHLVDEFKKPGFSSTNRSRSQPKLGNPSDPVGRCINSNSTDESSETINLQGPEHQLSVSTSPTVQTIVESNTKHETNSQRAKYSSMLQQLKYEEPTGSAHFDTRYNFEVLKNGLIVDKIEFSQDKSFYVIGRIPACDIVGEHPTLSRMHAVLQFIGSAGREGEPAEKGLYVYDLESTHGTFLNKNRLLPNKYYRIRVGHVLKFGNSTRLYVVVGPSDDEEEESEKTVAELMKEKNDKELKRKNVSSKGSSGGDKDKDSDEEDGISWGMGEDAVEEAGMSVNPFAIDFEEKELNLDNPKKTLHAWFEREGFDFHYDVKEKSSGHFICTVNLPLDGPGGASIIAEVDGKGKKKEIISQCALKACQILDKYGVLRKSHQEGFKRKKIDWEEKDYYSSDEDTFLDRTGSVEQKRKMRMKHAGKLEDKIETFDSLVDQYSKIQKEVDKVSLKIQKAEVKNKAEGSGIDDPLDAFMSDLKYGVTDIRNMKTKLKELNEEQNRVLKLINIVKPIGATFSPIHSTPVHNSNESNSTPPSKNIKVMFGPRKGISPSTQKSVNVSKPTKPIRVTESVQNPLVIDIEDDVVRKSGNLSFEKVIIKESVPLPSIPKSLTHEQTDKTIPINLHEDEPDVVEESEEALTKRKRKRIRQPQSKKEGNYEYDSNNPDYSIWVPPEDQAGDGKTKLNEKLGY